MIKLIHLHANFDKPVKNSPSGNIRKRKKVMMAPLQEAFSGMHSCLSFTFVHEIYFLLGDKEKMPKPLSQVKTRMIKHIYSLCKTFTVCSTHLHSVQHIYTLFNTSTVCPGDQNSKSSTQSWCALGKSMFERLAKVLTLIGRTPKGMCVQ